MSQYNPDLIACRVDDESHEWINSEDGLVCCECHIPKEKPQDVEDQKSIICSVVVNDHGKILAYTCQSTIGSCEEFCKEFFPAWDRMKELGCKIVQAELTVL